jgi:hypothetical protein
LVINKKVENFMAKYPSLMTSLMEELELIEEAEIKLSKHKETVLSMLEEVRHTCEEPAFDIYDLSILTRLPSSQPRNRCTT